MAALKVSVATPAKQQTALAEPTISANTNQDDPLSKSDKLEVSYVDETQDKKAVRIAGFFGRGSGHCELSDRPSFMVRIPARLQRP